MEIAQSKFFNCFRIAPLSRIYRASCGISVLICFYEHFPEHLFLFMHINIMNPELLTWSTINVIESFSTCPSFTSFITAANFGPTFFHDLSPKLACSIFINLSTIFISLNFGFCKTELFNSLFIHIKWKPVINYNLCRLSINMELHSINTSLIEFAY